MFHKRKQTPVGSYRMDVISLPEECDWERFLPFEIKYIFHKYPQYKERVRDILARGKAVGIRTVLNTPENILKAVHTISVHSQKNYIITWLPKLLRDKHLPVISDADRAEAKECGEDLDEAVEIILKERLAFKKMVLVDEENKGIRFEEQQLMKELSEQIYPLSIDYVVHRIIADNARERTHIAQAIVKTLLVIGPVTHILEKFVAGIGKIFAASADDLLGETAELMALRGSGFAWRELAKRSKILVPVFIIAAWGAFSVEGLLEEGKLVLGGVVFGLSAVALSLTTAVQSVFMYRRNLKKLCEEKKVVLNNKQLLRMAITQDFTNPARLGLLLGSAAAPFMGIIGSLLGLMHNGWVLAVIGSTESIVAGLTIIFANRINENRFRAKLLKRMKRAE